MLKPVDLKADLNRPCDSLIDESQRPMTEKVGMPGEMETSIKETVDSVPVVKQEYIRTMLGFEAMLSPPFTVRIASSKTKYQYKIPANFPVKNRQDFLQKQRITTYYYKNRQITLQTPYKIRQTPYKELASGCAKILRQNQI